MTVCAFQKRHLFGSIRGEAIVLSELGKIAESELAQIPLHFHGVNVGAYTVMPNHLHCIIVIDRPECNGQFTTLSSVMGLYKSGVARRIHLLHPQMTVWQKSFYDHILRNDAAYREVLGYMEENPLKWELDEYYGENNGDI